MVEYCLENEQLFGVVLIRSGQEALGPLAEPFPIGCTAQITQVQHQPQDRFNLLAVGKERFNTISLDAESSPYLIGNVELFPFQDCESDQARREADSLRPLVKRHLALVAKMENAQVPEVELSADPGLLGYLSASILQVPDVEKQALLSITSIVDLLIRLRAIYRKETALLEVITGHSGDNLSGKFSQN